MEENKTQQAAVEELKARHGEIYQITVEGRSCIVRKPTRRDLSFAMAGSNGGRDIVKMEEILLGNCWLQGDESLRSDDAAFFAVAEKLAALMETKEAELKKL